MTRCVHYVNKCFLKSVLNLPPTQGVWNWTIFSRGGGGKDWLSCLYFLYTIHNFVNFSHIPITSLFVQLTKIQYLKAV